ncbi:hypothetical protein [Parabacteroides merdae]|mgnify:CR=1 FL=1|uniref:hypothetical protein n=1 Tax=Parabacteroides merdae TaxID=46503 RepID=UPI00356200BF
MKTRIFSFLFFILLGSSCFIQKTNAQWIVNDPKHEFLNTTEWLANAQKWVKQIEEMGIAQKLREGLQNINEMKQLRSLVELASFLDDVACLSSDYRFYMNIGGHYHCLKFLNFQSVTVNLNLSTDLLFKVATVADFFSMNSEGRMSFVGDVRTALESASKEMKEFNEVVRSEVLNESVQNHVGKTYYSGRLSAFTRYTN